MMSSVSYVLSGSLYRVCLVEVSRVAEAGLDGLLEDLAVGGAEGVEAEGARGVVGGGGE